MKVFSYILTLLIFLSLTLVKSEKAGVKISVDQKILTRIQNKFLPPILDKYKNIKLPEQQLTIDLTIGNVYLNLTNIEINLQNLDSKNLVTSFEEPNLITMQIKNLGGTGKFDSHFEFWKVFSENDKVDLNVTSLNLVAKIQLTAQESSINKGKLLPSGSVSEIQLDIDFNFDINGSFYAKLASMFKGIIKSKITSTIQSTLKSTIVEGSKTFISEFVSNQTVYYNLNNTQFDLDYSLTSSPSIKNGSLNLFINGAVVDRSSNVTIPYPYDDLSDSLTPGKDIQVSIGSYIFNSALFTLYSSGMLKGEIKSDDIPSNSPIQFNTTILDTFIQNLSNMYGRDKKVINSCSATQAPMVKINSDEFSGQLDAECLLQVDKDDESYEDAMKYFTSLEFGVNATLQDEGVLTANIDKLAILNSKMINTLVPGSQIQYLEQFVDFAFSLGLPYINSKYLKHRNIAIPQIGVVSLNHTTVQLQDSFLKIEIVPEFNVESYIHSTTNYIDNFLGLKKSSEYKEISKMGEKFLSFE